MPPNATVDVEEKSSSCSSDDKQSLIIIRHGDRFDYSHPEWKKTAERRGDPPLSFLGHQQARELGVFLDSLFSQEGVENITWLSSPFLRTLQTSDDALNSFQTNTDDIQILPEYSVFELDGHGGRMHADLPPLQERANYFPRLDATYESLFIPQLPESRDDFLPRCDNSIQALNSRFAFSPRSAIVIITHAAACIGLTRAAGELTLRDIEPAAPCSVYRFTRTHADGGRWNLDKKLNGYADHLSEMGTTTVPWNHFGDKQDNEGYTGRPDSKFAPKPKVAL